MGNHRELWFIPAPDTAIPVEPLKLYAFGLPPSGIVETEPDVFYISTGKFYNTDEAFLQRLDLRGWVSGCGGYFPDPGAKEQVCQDS